jgi:hypothetical protein
MKSDEGEENMDGDHDPNGREETRSPITEDIAYAGGFLRGSPALSPTAEVEDELVIMEQDDVEPGDDPQGALTDNHRDMMGPKAGHDELPKERQP